MNILEKISVKYLLDNNKIFFAGLLNQIIKKETTSIPTAGICIENGNIYLYYNPKFLEEIKEKEGIAKAQGILEHELLHLVFDHISRASIFKRHQELYNIATDMAINQLIDSNILPKKAIKLIYPEQFNLPKKKDAEYYYKELLKNAVQVSFSSSSFDNHNDWQKGNTNEQIIKEIIKGAVREAKNICGKMKGNIPSYLESAIEELLQPPKINWKTLLKQYIGASIKTGYKNSWKRLNRRFSEFENIKGKVSNRTIRILLGIDTSGSIDNKDFQDFITEIKGIMNSYKCKIDIIQCDCELQKKEVLTPYRKMDIKFKGRGGTSFKPVFNMYNKNPFYNLLIYFTDLYGDENEVSSIKPVIWVTTKNYNKNSTPKVGRIVNITE